MPCPRGQPLWEVTLWHRLHTTQWVPVEDIHRAGCLSSLMVRGHLHHPPEKPGISPTERKGVRKVQNLIRFSLKSMRKIRITNMIEFSWK